ncbi:MAG: trypsin-like peptidase domain-containing protein [Bacteroidetes bacterium]|nr:trypsin-like peptidase domain-containing protein [Bacteroidota bacterium]
MNKYIITILLIIPTITFSQSLGSERIERLNKSVVRVLIDTIPSGTGFFVHDSGWVATCHHVIESAFIRNKTTNSIDSIRKVFIEFQNGEKVEMEWSIYLLNKGYKNAVAYDFNLLKTKTIPDTKFNKLKLGSWSDINEGDVVYTCGYPMGIQQKFISQGLFSTKWVDTIKLKQNNKPLPDIPREVAWLDVTMNKGNSGGAIIKLGEKPEDDLVIGIATFILNPHANKSEQIVEYLPKRGIDMFSEGISQNDLMQLLFDAISKNSIGVSGCVSIDYVSELLRLMYP